MGYITLIRTVTLTELAKMLAGQRYNGADLSLRLLREAARLACAKYNAHPSKGNLKHITRLFKLCGHAVLEPGFQCDYGIHIEIGDNFYANFGCILLDSNLISIGDNVMFGPGVHIYTVDHPRDAAQRAQGESFSKPVSIGDNVWIGGGAKVLPGVVIGDGAIIGANTVVTKNVAANSTFIR